MKIKDFAAKIKESYPEYKNMDNVELTNKVLESYPEYKDQVDPYEPPSVPEPKPYEDKGLSNMIAPRSTAYEVSRATAPYNPSAGIPNSEDGVLMPDQIAKVVAANQNPIDFKKYLGSAVSDGLSLIGRKTMADVATYGDVLQSPLTLDTYKNIPKNYSAYMSQTKGDNIVSDIVRSPATGAVVATGGLGLIPASIAGATASQVENVGDGKDVNLGQAALEAGGGIVGGKVLGAVGNKAVELASNKLTNKAWNLMKSFIDKGSDITEEMFSKYKITGKSAEEILTKIKQSVKSENRVLDDIKKSPAKTDPKVNKESYADALKSKQLEVDKLKQLHNSIVINKNQINDKIKNPDRDILDKLLDLTKYIGVKQLAGKTLDLAGNKAAKHLDAPGITDELKKKLTVGGLRKLVKLEKSSGIVSKYRDAIHNINDDKLINDLANNEKLKVAYKKKIEEAMGEPLNDELIGIILGQQSVSE